MVINILLNPLSCLIALDMISHMRVVSAIHARSEKEQPATPAQSVVPITSPSSLPGAVTPASDFNPLGPLVMCSFLPLDFLDCKDAIDHDKNHTAKAVKGYGCLRFGGSTYDEVEHTEVQCTVFPDIDCYGPRTFLRGGIPCIRYTDHYFVTTLIYSILLGFLGMDRFCLGQTGTAVGKLLTIGGVGVWWVIDIILLITNNLLPEDGSNWNPFV
ncbi:TM2 domain-containing protein CG11103 [Ceratitis capitata]|uniref:TM2 domain-containing protein CG11103 n=1 Tax=Ceratitis capitata TaxID=7213 RepID=W8CB25_CERCA|nr:TM2 domain-containing protein CG11103 [Ceratitis capitata]